MADEREMAQDPEKFYRRRPAVWEPNDGKKKRRLTWWLLGLAGVAGLCAVVLVPRFELFFLSSPAERVRAVVVSVVGGVPTAESPGFYRHLARLEGGREIQFDSVELYRPGTRVEGMLSRGRITGRTRFTSPSRIVAVPK